MTGASPTLLSVSDLVVDYGPLRAVSGVSFDVGSGRVLAVLGANGAGKSSVARALCGLVPVTTGSIRFDGKDLATLSAHEISRAGVAYVPEGRGIFRSLTVNENLRIATRGTVARGDRAAAMERAFDLFPVLRARQQQVAGTLSGGEQQMLALVRALCTESRIVIADELSLGLAPIVVDEVFSTLEVAKSSGMTVIVIEQFIHRVLELADDCLILQRGTVAWAGEASFAGDEVQAKYLGQETALLE